MAVYESCIDEGDRQRERVHDPATAIECYKAALAIGGPRDQYGRHMIGVCLQMMRRYEEAIEQYRQLIPDASGVELANILRDMGESYGGLGRLQEAQDCISKSLDLLPQAEYPAEHAAGLGFLARLQIRQSRTAEAVKTFAAADEQLRRAGVPKLELYNKLHYASALSRTGRQDDMVRVIGEALTLIPNHGSPAHLRRAKALLMGGWRAEMTLSRVRQAPQTARQWRSRLLNALPRSRKA